MRRCANASFSHLRSGAAYEIEKISHAPRRGED
jgi:hypothetical protein